ncbi:MULTISPECIES: TrkH family potassium uptake protein [Fusobacterium]|uniref:TrkH family potassium uptake protein n=1 Tax=Fusobacterium TaxID=848 RepID=UPI0006CB45FA|nr:TrkH family potassium uptake protein [Fusobacterium sp. oral taxon 203]ALF26112.1 potassium transporter KtrB [Fusobacterium nucleatum subsp. nucleatum]ASS38867.1 potassium transporter KtrB [Fusobacterium sp. oral taxon 203]
MRKLNLLKKWDSLSPYRKLIFGFLVAIFIGVILLKMPFSLRENQNITVLDSLFTIVSAICVTGLSVVDISQVFTSTGQLIILFFIQLGGLGVMTVSIIVFLLVGKKMSFETRELLKEERNSNSNGGITNFIKNLLLTVSLIEILGASILAYGFSKYYPLKKSIFYGLFHSVSAFCNAGFSLFTNSLEDFRYDNLISLTVSFLIILGGIGFVTVNSLFIIKKKKLKNLSLTSKFALLITFFLLTFGTMLFLVFEYNNSSTLKGMNFMDKILNSFFQSVTLRTAGFNTVPLENIKPATVFISYIFMFIGASPGSTGGGIKTTTFGILIFYAFGVLKRKEYVEVFKRRIDWELINKALAIVVISILYIAVIITILLSIENFSTDRVIYEVISAFSTTGLSMGITASLGIISKFLIIITMFIGRLGPMTVALAFTNNKKSSVKYPKEDILIG